jgi:hypothetical protein
VVFCSCAGKGHGLVWVGRVDRSGRADRIASGGHWLAHHLAELSTARLVNGTSLWYSLSLGRSVIRSRKQSWECVIAWSVQCIWGVLVC